MGRGSLKRFWMRVARSQSRAMGQLALRTRQKLNTLKGLVPRGPRPMRQPRVSREDDRRLPMATGRVGQRAYHLFEPAGDPPATGWPLMVMLHGCGQDARGFACSTGMNRLASSAGFMVLYPEQDRLAHAQACWNWFDVRSGRAQREAASILAVVDALCETNPVDRQCVVVAGLSAGASMAALLALQSPERFLAVAMHSGVGPGVAVSTATALSAMRGQMPGGGARLPAPPAGLPALLVIQGSRDTVVVPSNGPSAVQRWSASVKAERSTPRVVQRGARYAVTLNDWRVGKQVVATLAEVAGLGHAWSGGVATQAHVDPAGPDASRMVWAFAQRERARRDAMPAG
jgi:poly(hydroxyalkanoate) depolymerase family esterase